MSTTRGTLWPEFTKGLVKENPTFVQVLGMCPALAVTNSAINGIAMGVATTFVLVMSSLLVSALRKLIPSQVRISTYIVVIATFVTVADFTLQALAPDVHREMGAFVPLIVVNCIILGRAEAFASRNPDRALGRRRRRHGRRLHARAAADRRACARCSATARCSACRCSGPPTSPGW